jgi:hypothetical protein
MSRCFKQPIQTLSIVTQTRDNILIFWKFKTNCTRSMHLAKSSKQRNLWKLYKISQSFFFFFNSWYDFNVLGWSGGHETHKICFGTTSCSWIPPISLSESPCKIGFALLSDDSAYLLMKQGKLFRSSVHMKFSNSHRLDVTYFRGNLKKILPNAIQRCKISPSVFTCMDRPCHSGPSSSPGHVGFVVDKAALRQVFSEDLSFHRLLHIHHHLLVSSGARTIGQLVADVPSELSLTPPPKIKNLPVPITHVEIRIEVVMNCSISWDVRLCQVTRLRNVELYLYSPIRLHGVVLN